MIKFKKFLYKNKDNKLFVFIDKFIYRFVDHRITEIGASLVYFAILSIFPFLIALLNIINYTNILTSESLEGLISYLPGNIAIIVDSFINEINTYSSSSLLSFSIIMVLFTASNILHKIMKNISLAYGFKDDRGFIKERFLSLIFTLAILIMVIMLMTTQVFGKVIVESLSKYFKIESETRQLIHTLAILITVAYMIITLALLYGLAPNKSARKLISYKTALPGAIFTTFVSIFVSQIFGNYVNNFANYSITYGSLAGIIILLVWMWLMSIILLLGAEVNGVIFSMKNFKTTNKWPRHESFFKNLLKDFED
ncbi:YihY/virulence factor BrkB family protein [Peptoniphilus catoniae]|uniref:YihY/virulence factor BrkB family protein n=1 Tax=Peptoniphilus catoniae TaxID=1660341 RepID=UPI0010FDE6CB|nr:YihY/virulence factor BrkB family protein [Peptoniphilus catoniae]